MKKKGLTEENNMEGMNLDVQVIIIGCGFTGSVIARQLAEELNLHVAVIEKRNHIAGNMFDYYDENGILIQKYGPHTFHTNNQELISYINRFSDWETFQLLCMTSIDGTQVHMPFNFATIDCYYSESNAMKLKNILKGKYGTREKVSILELLDSKETEIKDFAEFLWKKDYSLYTAKQWGILPEEVDPSILKRVPILLSYKEGYFDDLYQLMPKRGFTHFFKNVLNHKNIDLYLGVDARKIIRIIDGKIYLGEKETKIPVIYTGAIDELLDYKYGVLPYRSLKFEMQEIPKSSFQNAPVVAYPQASGYTRITEYTKLPVQKLENKTVIVKEFPVPYSGSGQEEPYYPILTEQSIEVHNEYIKNMGIENLFLCGRLAEFKYFNMDQALENALGKYKDIKMYIENH